MCVSFKQAAGNEPTVSFQGFIDSILPESGKILMQNDI